MRLGVLILPEDPWPDARRKWQRAEQLGFDHAWTYDHLAWRGLRDSPWFGAVPTLAAAAAVTSTIRLGTLVASPEVRHPVPFVIAANGPRSLRLAVEYGAGWVTTGGSAETLEQWWVAVGVLARRLDDTLAEAGRDRASLDRYLLLDSSPVFSLSSADLFEEMAGRAGDLGFTDVITHWPRPEGVYAGDVAVLEEAASRLPRLRVP